MFQALGFLMHLFDRVIEDLEEECLKQTMMAQYFQSAPLARDGQYYSTMTLIFDERRQALTSLQQRLVKTGGRLIKHARYYWLLLAESHLTRRLFGSMLRRMEALPLPAG